MAAVILNDVTLREGVQVALKPIGPHEKATIGHLLDEAGVPQLQIGYPGRSEADREAVRLLKGSGCHAYLEGLCSLGGEGWADEIATAVASGIDRLVLVFPIADYRLSDVMHITRQVALERISAGIRHGRALGVPIALAPIEGSRSDPTFLREVLDAAVLAGADRFYLVDTVGVLYPRQTTHLVTILKPSPSLLLGIHAHNDFGCALANSLAAIEAGVEVVDVSVAGLGKRAGNAALEQMTLALHMAYGLTSGVHLESLYSLARQITEILGTPLSPVQPLVGANAFDFEVDTALRGTSAHTVVSGISRTMVGHPGNS